MLSLTKAEESQMKGRELGRKTGIRFYRTDTTRERETILWNQRMVDDQKRRNGKPEVSNGTTIIISIKNYKMKYTCVCILLRYESLHHSYTVCTFIALDILRKG